MAQQSSGGRPWLASCLPHSGVEEVRNEEEGISGGWHRAAWLAKKAKKPDMGELCRVAL